MRSLIDILDFSVSELYELMDTAKDIAQNPKKYECAAKGKKLATLFFEPSTRTRLSFEAAMLELGGSVIGFSDAGSSSATKGETVADTAKIISCYADIIAMRHPSEGAPLVAARNASIPVINAGDGGHSHPTQTLADIYTIFSERGNFEGLTIGYCGDLKYGRTVHSLISALSRYKGVKTVLISPKELKLPSYLKSEILHKNNMEYEETVSLEESIGKLDVLYMTRVQRERFDDAQTYEKLKDSYILDNEKLKNAKKELKILHPLPRVNEISVEVDDDPRACYFKQALGGKYMRMALILKLLDEAEKSKEKLLIKGEKLDIECKNKKCITHAERGLKPEFEAVDKAKGNYKCIYCETEVKI